MHWTTKYSSIFFDFDGLLVNSEELHYKAYQKMLEAYEKQLSWDFTTFLGIAHISAKGLEEALTKCFPDLVEKRNWKKLYEEKKKIYLDLIANEKLTFMAGAEEFLTFIQQQRIPHCVVTHSPFEQVKCFQEKLPLLQQIPLWITREDYKNPKPAPDAYLLAKEKLKDKKGKSIGFEDALRGVIALKKAGISPVLICSPDHPQLQGKIIEDLSYFPSFHEVLNGF